MALTWVVRLLYAGSAVAYLTHLWLIWRRFRVARAVLMGTLPSLRPRRARVTVHADILMHHGEGFLLRDVRPTPDE